MTWPGVPSLRCFAQESGPSPQTSMPRSQGPEHVAEALPALATRQTTPTATSPEPACAADRHSPASMGLPGRS